MSSRKKERQEMDELPIKPMDDKQLHFTMVRNFYLADIITLLNGACGVMSIFASMRFLISYEKEDLYVSMIAMPMGLFFDFFDGRVARWRKNSSLLGQELDSLADLVSFGVAPAAFAFSVGMQSILDTVVLTYFVCCGIARLARYNSTVALMPKDQTGKIHHFEGTPVPTSLAIVGFLSYLVINNLYLENLPGQTIQLGNLDLHPLVLLYGASGTLMISKTLLIPKP